jgi:hypothetical protein
LKYLLQKIDDELWKKVKIKAIQQGVPVRIVFLRFLNEYVKEDERNA